MENTLLFRLAGSSALLGIPALLLSGFFLVLFFGGYGERYGPLNDIFTAVALLLLALPAIAVFSLASDETGVWLAVVTWLAVAGMVVGAAGQLLLVAGVISLETSFVTGGFGIMPVMAWAVAIVVLSLGSGLLPPSIGWLTIAVLVLSLSLAIAPGLHLNWVTWSLGILLVAALSAWLGRLGWYLIRLA